MVLTLNGKTYEVTEDDVFKEYGIPPYAALQQGKVVICKYESVTRSDEIEVVYKQVTSASSMRKLYNSSEEGELLNMTWHLAKKVSLANKTASQVSKTPDLDDNQQNSPVPNSCVKYPMS